MALIYPVYTVKHSDGDTLKIFNKKSYLVVYGDHAKMSSLFKAANEIKSLTDHIDALFLNAGTMGKCRLNYFRYIVAFLTFKVLASLTCDATKVRTIF